ADATQSHPHEEVQLSLTLGGPQPDLSGTAPDGAANDLAAPSGMDLLSPNADLAPRTLGTLSIVAGQNGGPGGAGRVGNDTRLQAPTALVIAGTTLYMVDGRGRLRKVDLTTMTVTTIPLMTMGGSPFTLSNPQGLAYDGASTFYTADTSESVIHKIVL